MLSGRVGHSAAKPAPTQRRSGSECMETVLTAVTVETAKWVFDLNYLASFAILVALCILGNCLPHLWLFVQQSFQFRKSAMDINPKLGQARKSEE